MSAERPLAVLSPEIVARVQTPNSADQHPRAERERLFFEAMVRVLDRELPGYAKLTPARDQAAARALGANVALRLTTAIRLQHAE